jgi:hypothetical protein
LEVGRGWKAEVEEPTYINGRPAKLRMLKVEGGWRNGGRMLREVDIEDMMVVSCN